jgi:hypothetical protein
MKPPTNSISRNSAFGMAHGAETEFMNISSPFDNNNHKAIRRLQSGHMPLSIKHPVTYT